MLCADGLQTRPMKLMTLTNQDSTVGLAADQIRHVTQPISDLEQLRSLMPVIREDGVYLDHAAAGVLPQPVIDAMSNRIHSAASHGVRHWNHWQKLVHRTRKLVAELIGGHEDEVAFVPNTASGIGIVAEGFRWQSGDNVVLPAAEFPSNRFPWLNLNRRGVEVRQVDAPDDPDGCVSALDEACDSNTRIIACSWVDYGTGVRRDPARLAEVAHRHGGLLVLDAIQGMGVLPLELHAQEVDVVVADSRKWLLGPDGAGILAIRRDQQNLFEVTRPGWASTVDPLNFGATELQFSPTATRFESGMHNTFGLTGLHASLSVFRDISPSAREQRLLSVRNDFEDAGRSAGMECPLLPESAQSGILSFNHPLRESTQLIRQLRAHAITVSLKKDRVRVSPHFYNNADDVRQFKDALCSILG